VQNGAFHIEQDEALTSPILLFSVTPTRVLAFSQDEANRRTIYRF
jgi:hypothetical protein